MVVNNTKFAIVMLIVMLMISFKVLVCGTCEHVRCGYRIQYMQYAGAYAEVYMVLYFLIF